jgi:hypothetical protein
MTQIFDRPTLSDPEMVRDLPEGTVIAWEMMPGEPASLAVGIVRHSPPDEPSVGARTWIACWERTLSVGQIASPPTVLYPPSGKLPRIIVEPNDDVVLAGLNAAVTLCSTNWDPDRDVERAVLPIARVFTRYLADPDDVPPVADLDPALEKRWPFTPERVEPEPITDVLRLRRLAAEMVWAKENHDCGLLKGAIDDVRRAASRLEWHQ